MKIVKCVGVGTELVGKICDHCGDKVQVDFGEEDSPSATVARALLLGRFVEIDIDQSSCLQRADLCERCVSQVLDAMRPFLCSFRDIARTGERGDRRRSYKYRMIDAETGHPFEVSSMVDELEL